MASERLVKAASDLRSIGEDCQRGAFGPNLAERLWDIADVISSQLESGWQPIETKHVGQTMLVTNNPYSRNADGDMSHRWIGWIQQTDEGEFICFDDADRKVCGLRMCHPLPAPPKREAERLERS